MLDQGVYTLAEVSQYTGVSPTTLRAWFLPRPDGKGLGPIFGSDWARVDDDFAVSFLNLIEAFVASSFKKNHVKPAIVRRAHEILRGELATAHPFAHAELEAECGRIIQARRAGGIDTRFADVISRQLHFPEFHRKLTQLEYDSQTRLASRWRIAAGVTVDPRTNFGKPAVIGTGVSTLILAEQYLANDRREDLVGRLFKVSPAGVLHAFEFEQGLGRIAA